MASTELLAGRNSVREALLAGRRRFAEVLIADGAQSSGAIGAILRLCQGAGVPVARRPQRELDRLSQGLTHQGVLAQVSAYPYAQISDMLALAQSRDEMPFLLVFDSIQDPQNVGSLVRTAEAVGVHGLVVMSRRAAGITPAVSRASAGAVEHLLVAQVVNLARTLDQLKAEGLWVVGLEEHAAAQDYRAPDLRMPLALVLGSEGSGMRPLVLKQCDLLLRIPMRGRISSLNVAVAGSLALYRAWHAREGD
ncbi:MAG: 23S rRNA (guanosine(2251)-2'-O)-methyltransferase RlmB [Anaerolineae bacterium]|nr:23S rRNA (guanosine(2251)-2'-O)-methyltransferase RlmB [Anaerolineae bacterium]